MSGERMQSKEEDTKERSKNIASQVPPECLEDPRFIKVLATSLLSEIATLELILKETDADIKLFKGSVTTGLEKRKVLKELTRELTKKKDVLGNAYEALERESKYRSIEVETVKNRLDDATLREYADRAKYKKILENYQETWQKYKAEYEERPLAKERQKACVVLKKLRGQLAKAEYEKENLTIMLKQRKKIDDIRVRVSIVEISGMTLQRWKDQKHIDHLNAVASQLQDKLKAYTSQLTQLEQEEEKKKRSEIEASIMPPPRLDFSFMRSICNEQGKFLKKGYMGISPTPDPDSMSINTLMLEEMCNSAENDEAPKICRKIDGPVNEDKEQSFNLPNSVSMIQEREPLSPIASELNAAPALESMNQLDVQKKLMKLGIEQQQSHEKCKPTDKNDVNERNDYGTNQEESHQRTLRWCEESRRKFARFSARKSSSFNEQTRDDFNDADYKSVGRKFAKAMSVHGSDTKSLRQAELEKRYKNGVSMEIGEESRKTSILKHSNEKEEPMDEMETQDQRRRQSGEKLGKNTASAVAESHSRQRKLPDPIASPAVNTPTSIQQTYETPQLKTPLLDNNVASQESKDSDDHLELPIDASCSRPKIRKVEVVNYPLGQRPDDPVVMNSRQSDILCSPKQYVPSYMSSNLSHTFEAALQETPRVSFCGESKQTPGFPTLSNWKNWSQPNSETSIASSISNIGQNKETPNDKQDDLPKEQSQPSQFNFGGFFSLKPTQNPRNLF